MLCIIQQTTQTCYHLDPGTIQCFKHQHRMNLVQIPVSLILGKECWTENKLLQFIYVTVAAWN